MPSQPKVSKFWKLSVWAYTLAQITLVVYFYFLLEWLFFVTKPSFLSPLNWDERITILWLSPLVLLLPILTVFVLLRLLALLWVGSDRAGLATLRLMGGFMIGCTMMQLIDNFTLTVADLGIRDTSGASAWLYLAALLALALYFSWRLRQTSHRGWLIQVTAGALFIGSLVGLVISDVTRVQPLSVLHTARGSQVPNILFLSSDGLDASALSVYGFERDTTPNLRDLSPELLFCENAFSNANSTGGSITSLLTGKLPTETRVIYPPDILRGKDAFEHLPALLRSRGYTNWHLSIRHYADPFDLNLQESFDFSNGQKRTAATRAGPVTRVVGTETAYFVGQTFDRVESRLLHLLQIRPIPDVFAEVTMPQHLTPRDEESVARLIDFVKTAPQPFFAQLHMMGTHGPRFRPPKRLFSKEQEQNEPWMIDFYHDAILAFDERVGQVVRALRKFGLLDNTILVIYTDHAWQFRTGVRIPLMFRFPTAQHAGRIKENTQLLDVAPTILDYLGSQPPRWMSGRSLISDKLDPLDPIIIATQRVDAAVKKGRVYEIDEESAGPPLYSMGGIRTVICNVLFTLDLVSFASARASVSGHTYPCDPKEIPPLNSVRTFLVTHLLNRGYEVRDLDRSVDERDLFVQIAGLVQELERQGKSRQEIQQTTWDIWGQEIAASFNEKEARHETIPAWLDLAIEWADSHSKIEVVQAEGNKSGRPFRRALPKKP